MVASENQAERSLCGPGLAIFRPRACPRPGWTRGLAFSSRDWSKTALSGQTLAISNLRMYFQDLGVFVDTEDHPLRRFGILEGDVLEDVLQPSRGLFRPRYFCHARIL